MRHIILIACAVVLLMALPLGASQATLLENQVVNQVNQPTAAITGCTSAARSSPLVTLTAGREYVVVSGARSSTAGQQNSRVDFVAAGNGGSGYVTRNGTVTQHAPLQTNLVLLRHHNLTTINYDAFWFAVRMNPTSTIQLEIYTFSDTSSHSPILSLIHI